MLNKARDSMTLTEVAANPASPGTPEPVSIDILIVEDDPDDVEFLTRYLNEGLDYPYKTQHATCLGEALTVLKTSRIDLVLLDLGLPDAAHARAVLDIRGARNDLAIIVVTGHGDEDIENACFEAGAQDFLVKKELSPHLVKRAIGYALFRIRGQQISELTSMLENYRDLSSAGLRTGITGRSAGGGPIAERFPLLYENLKVEYRGIVRAYMKHLALGQEKPVEAMERLVTQLGDQRAGPRDVMDIHVALIRETMGQGLGEKTPSLAMESRLLALEIMGMLVNYYRVGTRRR